MSSMFWFRYSAGVMLFFLNTARANRSLQLPLGTATVLPFNHFNASCGLVNAGASGRAKKTLHWSWPRPMLATMRRSATSRFVAPTMPGMSPT